MDEIGSKLMTASSPPRDSEMAFGGSVDVDPKRACVANSSAKVKIIPQTVQRTTVGPMSISFRVNCQ